MAMPIVAPCPDAPETPGFRKRVHDGGVVYRIEHVGAYGYRQHKERKHPERYVRCGQAQEQESTCDESHGRRPEPANVRNEYGQPPQSGHRPGKPRDDGGNGQPPGRRAKAQDRPEKVLLQVQATQAQTPLVPKYVADPLVG